MTQPRHIQPPKGARLAADPVVELVDISFSYSTGPPVLSGASLGVSAGEIVGVVGPSGCGKSTLLSLIADIAAPTSGAVIRRFGGNGRHPLSMVFQRDTLLPWLTAAENVRFFARFKTHRLRRTIPKRLASIAGRKADDELDERVQDLLDLMGLGDRGDSYPYQLSGGMRRRLAFLSAVAVEPEMLLLDEPFSSVDEPTRIGIHQDVFRIARQRDMTMLLVTHDLAEAITLCDRVVILSNRPAAVAAEHRINFGDDRNMLALRERDDYLELYKQLWHSLSEQIAASKRAREAAMSNGKVES